MKLNPNDYRISSDKPIGRIALIIAIVGLLAGGAGLAVNSREFYFAYLTAIVFWTSIGLGGLFLILLHHLSGAHWSTVLRRFAESAALTLPLMAVLFIPVIIGAHHLYHWAEGSAAADPVLQKKAAYLNLPFFIIRTAVYFGVWSLLAVGIARASRNEDAGDLRAGQRMKALSAVGMIVYAFTITYAAFDWMMSLDAHWYSTIYGVGFFTGAVLSFLALLVLILRYTHKKGILRREITIEHYHDIGKLLYAFMILWTYMAFSQYFLIWYANIPEETTFYHHRWVGSWKGISLILVFGHFALPFIGMMSRPAKRNPRVLTLFAGWLLLMHLTDIIWNIYPNLHHHGFHLTPWLPLLTTGIGGLFLWRFWRVLAAYPVIPVGDPNLKASIQLVQSY